MDQRDHGGQFACPRLTCEEGYTEALGYIFQKEVCCCSSPVACSQGGDPVVLQVAKEADPEAGST